MELRERHEKTHKKTASDRIIQEAVVRVVLGNLKLGEIKGCDRSKEKGSPVKGAHNGGNGKTYFSFSC